MTKKERYGTILAYFEQAMAAPETELHYNNPYELLVAVILSAQCTDKRVNLTTPALFARYPDAASLAASDSDEVFGYIRSISYPNNKAKHLVGMGTMLQRDFAGEVPSTVEDLVKLPGVGRKTANVIVSVIHSQPAMAVDTHVFRVSKRLGLVKADLTTPLQVELELMKHLPKDKVHLAHHWLILHGRYTCMARNPQCSSCGLQQVCQYYAKAQKAEAKKSATDSVNVNG
jgi:endonuclease III